MQNLSSLSIGQAQKESMVLKYETTRDMMEVNNDITNAISSNDISALETTAANLKDKKYLDGSVVQKYRTEIASKIATLQQNNRSVRINGLMKPKKC